ncbi:hypothetical protein BCR44DRAFT_1432153 [Catenaria anguillulae PL171]|uniref:Uncharacterized protein n=1 Tax=Catenaria anguillulae PL171 TaxID=765915 RepID=A0A1Y2HPW3_9FUNG|nr:hypothetical protein BCR44DRAFT_1432153 [Catenaria anguillulae PL171]
MTSLVAAICNKLHSLRLLKCWGYKDSSNKKRIKVGKNKFKWVDWNVDEEWQR